MNLTIKEEWYKVAGSIQDSQRRAEFYEILTRYFFDGTEPEEDGSPALLMFKLIRKDVDRDKAEKSGRRKRRESAPKQRPKPKPKPTAARPARPTVEEIAAYVKEKGYGVDAQRFFDYYESNGWRVGRNPMKSWKNAVGYWASHPLDVRRGGGAAWQKEHDAAGDYMDVI